MKKDKDWDYIAKLEKEIKNKFGDEAVKNPKSYWNEEKEKLYLEELKKISYDNEYADDHEKIDINGILIPKKLINREIKRVCPVCDEYSFDIRDDLYMNKYKCCHKCFYKYIEGGREERWLNGWRPLKGEKNENN